MNRTARILFRRVPATKALAALGAALAIACGGEDITAPSCERCAELRILSDRAEYRPGGVVRFTISNLTQGTLRYDWCSITLASRTTEVPFKTVYTPTRRCGRDAGMEQVLQNLQTIAPGESRHDSLVVLVALQSQQRVHLWLVDANGNPETGNPVASNVFLVYPGASQKIGEGEGG